MADSVERKRTGMYKACIFDLDGTLADTVESIANVANQILERFGAPAQPVEDYKYHAGDGGNVLMERCMKAARADMSHLEEGQRLYREIFAENPLYKVTVFDGMKETLEELKRRGVKLAVLSNKPHEAACLAVTGLFGTDTFEVIRSTENSQKTAGGAVGVHVCGRYEHRYEDRKSSRDVYYRCPVGISGPEGTGRKSCG